MDETQKMTSAATLQTFQIPLRMCFMICFPLSVVIPAQRVGNDLDDVPHHFENFEEFVHRYSPFLWAKISQAEVREDGCDT